MIEISKTNKVILHIDVDSFFVSCEVALRPELINRQIAISLNHPNSIVSSLSYEAKNKGCQVPWKLSKVKQYCPDLVVLKPNHKLYKYYHKKIYDFLFQNYSKNIEIVSVDEWYLDISEIWKSFGSIQNLAEEIQDKIASKFSLPISIGISYNKFLAKMATSINKPKGITFITYNNYQEIIWSMPITNYYGIGPKTSQQLINLGILTIGDLAKSEINNTNIRKIFLNKAGKFINNANGIGDSKINLNNNILSSISNEKTFINGFSNDMNEVKAVLYQLAQIISDRMVKRSLYGSNISLMIKLDKKKKSKSIQINKLINSSEEIYFYAALLLKSIWNEEELIGVGIKISKLKNYFQKLTDHSLFIERKEPLNKTNIIIEEINTKMKSQVVMNGKDFQQNINKKQNKFI